MSRKHFSALLVLAIVVALAVTLLVPVKTGMEEAGEPGLLLPDIGQRINDAEEVTVSLAEDGTVATLRRDERRWTIAELSAYPADWGKLQELLAGLAQARIVEFKTDNPAYYDRLGVQDFDEPGASGVLLELALGEERVGVIIGKEAEGRDGQYVRLAGSPRSVLVDRVLDVPVDLVDWADRRIIDVGSYLVAEVEIAHPDGDRVLARKTAADDTDFVLENLPKGREPISSWSVNSLAGALSGLRFESVRGDDGMAGQEAVNTRLLTFSGVEYSAEAWSGDDGYWMRVKASAPAVAEDAAGDETAMAAARENAEKVAALNDRAAGWIFKITDSKFSAMTKRLEQVLKPLEGESDS